MRSLSIEALFRFCLAGLRPAYWARTDFARLRVKAEVRFRATFTCGFKCKALVFLALILVHPS